MTAPHVIRLRGPWDLEPLVRYVPTSDGQYREETHDLPAGRKVPVPGDWAAVLGQHFLGTARYTRRFNCPTSLKANDRVWLVVERVDFWSSLSLNAQPLGEQSFSTVGRYEIQNLLEPHNTLTIDISMPPTAFADPQSRAERAHQSGGLIGEVRLEIEAC